MNENEKKKNNLQKLKTDNEHHFSIQRIRIESTVCVLVGVCHPLV